MLHGAANAPKTRAPQGAPGLRSGPRAEVRPVKTDEGRFRADLFVRPQGRSQAR